MAFVSNLNAAGQQAARYTPLKKHKYKKKILKKKKNCLYSVREARRGVVAQRTWLALCYGAET